VVPEFWESIATGGKTLEVRMSTSAGNTDFLNSLNLGWRWVCLELFEHSRHCGSHNTSLLIDCMCELGYLRIGIDITGIYWGRNRFASGIANLGFVFNHR
nr:hypothetical protein [Tanacetum cinerariifolium]